MVTKRPKEFEAMDDFEQRDLIRNATDPSLAALLLRFHYRDLKSVNTTNIQMFKDLVDKKIIEFKISPEGYKLLHVVQWLWPDTEARILKEFEKLEKQEGK